MKILMVTSGMDIGGAETHISELCFALAERGITVWIASAGGACVRELEKRGIPHITLPLNRKAPSALLAAMRGLRDLIRKESFDIVHAHARTPAFLCGCLQKKFGFRFVTTDHARFRLSPILKKLTDWGEFTFAVSEDLREYLMQNFHLNPSRISLTVNGIDTERFAPMPCDPSVRTRLHAGERAVVLHISRLEKDLSLCAHALMGAAEILEGKITVVIAGDGSYRGVLQKEARALNEKLGYPAVIFLGALSDVERTIAASDIVVSPSRAAMEAMACGKPTIVCGSQGYGGIFSEAIAKRAVSSNFCFRGSPLPSPEVLARDICTVLEMDEKERKMLGELARRFIKENYSVDIMVKAYLDGYRRIAESRANGYDILICGYYGYGNAGDEALLSVIVSELLRQNPSLRLCALSADPEKTKRELHIDAIARFHPDAVTKAIERSQMLLFGGGNLLQDKTSTHSLLYYTHILSMAKKRALKIFIYANGIGPLGSERNRERAKAALMLADEISLRDPDSLAFAQSLPHEAPIRLTFDPAILAQKTDFPSPCEHYFVIAPKRSSPAFTESLICVILALAQKTGMTPVLVSMYEKQDAPLAERIAAKTGALISRPQSAGEFLSLFSSATLVISSRLHGLVYATAALCPMIGYSDDPKIFSYLGYIGFGAGTPLDCALSTDIEPEAAVARAMKILSAQRSYREQLAHKLPEWKALAEKGIPEVIRLLEA